MRPVQSNAVSDAAVTARDLSKVYRVYDTPWDRIWEAALRRPRHRDFVAVDGVSFELPKGEGLGLIGQNGAGKSTLLKMLAGIVAPTSGALHVGGKVASILELGSGFHPEFTGRQNIVLNAAMLGLSELEVREKTPQIIEFSELGDFIDQPVKTYSTGMSMRLGFAIATQVDPDVLIIDEALSVGDGYFQKKCMDRLQRFLAAGGTLLFCSHAMYYVSAFCRRAIWLRRGRTAALGPTDDVIREYEGFLLEKSRAAGRPATAGAGGAEEPEKQLPGAPADAGGPKTARIVDVRLTPAPEDGEASGAQLPPGSPLTVEIAWESASPDPEFQLGVGLNRADDDLELASFSSLHDGQSPWTGATTHRARLELPELPLVKGEFTLYVYLLDEAGLHIHDRRILPRAFRIAATGYRFGVVRIPHTWRRDEGAAAEPAGLVAGGSAGAC
ncbi:MAG: ABC transporter ATP-binding protein [Thermoanaerobaculia bacterium]